MHASGQRCVVSIAPTEIHTLSLHDALPILEQLDFLLLEIPKSRKVHSDGIHFQGFRYSNTNLAAYVGEYVLYRKPRSEEHTSELQSRFDIVCRLLLEKKKPMP